MTRATENLGPALLFAISAMNLLGAGFSVYDARPTRAVIFAGLAVGTFLMGRWAWNEDVLEDLGTVDRYRETYVERTHRHES